MLLGVELARVLAFVAAVCAVYAFAALLLARRFLYRRRAPIGRSGRCVLAAAGFGLLCMGYGRFVEPRWIEVTRTRVESSRLPPGHRGVRIVHLSDIHSDPVPLCETRLASIVEPLAPDLIVFTGDCANSTEGLPVFQRCMSELAKLAPTFAVRGNWDTFHRSDAGFFDGTGVVELDGTSASVEVAGVRVTVVGAAYQSEERLLGRAIAALPATESSGPVVALYHMPYPEIIPFPVAPRVDLMCAGHVHGGQVALPFYGALLTLSRHGKRFESGLYPATDRMRFPLYVSRGIGMEGGSTPRVRFCARPEVALIELVAR